MKRVAPILPIAFALAMLPPIHSAFAQASAETAPSMAPPATPELAPGVDVDRIGARQKLSSSTFVTKISGDNTFEIEAARIALQKANLKEIKKLAQRMIHDHTEAEDELKTAMAGEGERLPRVALLDPWQQDNLKTLQSLTGREFDASYLQMMKMAHEHTIALVKEFRVANQDPRLKVFAEELLPVIEGHLREIEQIRRQENMG